MNGVDTVLEVEGLSKLYSRHQQSTRKRLATSFFRSLVGLSLAPVGKLEKGEFWSLKNISFSLSRGEALGIIGFNGAGKTTLLRLLAGQLLPDEGEIRMLGNAVAMIDLTAGFQTSASGRRNIYLRGAMLGRSQQDIEDSFEQIVEFSELGDALDAPISTYSKGMLMRLAFSVMVSLKPDILFIDEILSVGDFQFRQKCLAKIREMRSRSAFVFVSHSMADIGRFCDRVMVLNKGVSEFFGDVDDAIDYYLNNLERDGGAKALSPNDSLSFKVIDKAHSQHTASIVKNLDVFYPKPYKNTDMIGEVSFSVDGSDTERVFKRCFEKLEFTVMAQINAPCRKLIFGFTVLTEAGEGISGVASDSQQSYLKLSSADKVIATVTIDELSLMPGKYVIYFNMREGVELLYRSQLFEVVVDTPPHNTFGVTLLSHKWSVGQVQDS